MKNWNDYLNCLIRSLSIITALFFIGVNSGNAQRLSDRSYIEFSPVLKPVSYAQISSINADTTLAAQGYPDPTRVLYKSLIIPGWGQIENKQAWKVPIIYGVLAGLTGYSIFLTKKYHDYRAAFYNQSEQSPNDERFGSTPDYLVNANSSLLQSNRDNFRNRRDFIYVTLALAYGLNAIDAFIFAHLRSFDVSEDLSVRTTLKPNILANTTPGVTISLNLFKKN